MSEHRPGGPSATNPFSDRLDRRALLLAALVLPMTGVRAGAQSDADEPSIETAPPLTQAGPSADAIRELLAEQVDVAQDSVGYVAAVRDADGTRLVVYGKSGAANGRALDGDTVFEIGSVTKVFTALLLADMVARGEVALTDPAGKYLPPEGRPRTFDGKAFTLLDLVTYTSGLPRMPRNFRPKDPKNPYADYTVTQLYQFLSEYEPQYYPGSHYQYSNLGFALLGQVLALRAGRSYEDLIVSRICTPLGLDDTRITLTPAMRGRLAQGHDTALHDVPDWDLPTLAGAGALRSTANDLLRFLDACQGRRQTSQAPQLASLLDVRRQTDARNEYVAEGWFVDEAHGDELVWKNGGTGGFATFVGYSTRTGIAAVLLANTASFYSTTAIGKHLVNAEFPLPILRREAPIDPAKLSGYAGRYALALASHFVLTITPKDGLLLVDKLGMFFPESNTHFFSRTTNTQIMFELTPDGTASALVLHSNGRDRRALRLP